MSKRIIICVLVIFVLGLTACDKKTSDKNVSTEDKKNDVSKNIDISTIDESNIEYSYGAADMNVYNPSCEELSEKADIIFKGKLVESESYLNEQATINSDYTFVVSESYKGDVGSEVSINMLCGIMEKSLFVKQVMKHDGYEQSEIDKVEEEPGKYIAFGLEGFNPLDLNEEYVIYAKYHPEHDYYYPVYYFYGVYEQNDNGEYERYGLDENDKQIKKIEELVECIK